MSLPAFWAAFRVIFDKGRAISSPTTYLAQVAIATGQTQMR
jgi:hypothetical protein